jgi:glycosyltransferase involved in cell wall biosynthesis
MSSKNKITLFIPNLNGGGAERMMVTLANGFNYEGFEVNLLLCKKEGIYLRDLVQGIKIINLNSKTTFSSLFKVIRYLKDNRPDIFLSSLTNANIVAILAKRISMSPTKLFIREACIIPPISEVSCSFKLLYSLMKLVYPLAKNIIAISNGVKDDLVSKIRLDRSCVKVIYNPAVSPLLAKKKNETVEHYWLLKKTIPVIIAVGRLTRQKDFQTLIMAFSLVRKKKLLRLIIVGEGEEYENLKNLAFHIGYPDDISFTGFTTNPFALMSKADVFVLSSRWEGFGNVLVEAMGCGVNIVSTDCPSGPAEILEGGKWGILVPVGDSISMADAIEKQLESPVPEGMVNYVYNRFDEMSIVNEYLRILTDNSSFKNINIETTGNNFL